MRMYDEAGWTWFRGQKPTEYDGYIGGGGNFFEAENRFLRSSDPKYFESQDHTILSLKQFKQMQKRTIEDLEQGDILIDPSEGDRKVLGVCGEVFFLSLVGDFDAISGGYTLNEIKDREMSIKEEQVEEVVEELTMEEICKELGRDIKIKK